MNKISRYILVCIAFIVVSCEIDVPDKMASLNTEDTPEINKDTINTEDTPEINKDTINTEDTPEINKDTIKVLKLYQALQITLEYKAYDSAQKEFISIETEYVEALKRNRQTGEYKAYTDAQIKQSETQKNFDTAYGKWEKAEEEKNKPELTDDERKKAENAFDEADEELANARTENESEIKKMKRLELEYTTTIEYQRYISLKPRRDKALNKHNTAKKAMEKTKEYKDWKTAIGN